MQKQLIILRQFLPFRALVELKNLSACYSEFVSCRMFQRRLSTTPSPPLKIGLGSTNTSTTSVLLSEAQFHDLADNVLETIITLLAPLDADLDDADISYSQGVLNINLGAKGFWVINKQTPNRQLWWSSPMSGPRRYEYRPDAAQPGLTHGLSDVGSLRCWKGTSDGKDLISLLQSEMVQVTGIDIL